MIKIQDLAPPVVLGSHERALLRIASRRMDDWLIIAKGKGDCAERDTAKTKARQFFGLIEANIFNCGYNKLDHTRKIAPPNKEAA